VIIRLIAQLFLLFMAVYISLADMKKYTLIICLFLMIMNANARQGDPGMPGGDPDVPIDGGVGLLLLAGAAYGVKKIRDLTQH
jgi:hypothetical protein